jgi:tetratricopeptide (TPR) repeat protein
MKWGFKRKQASSSSAKHNKLGVLLVAKCDLDGAIAEYRKAVAIDPDLTNAWGMLGLCYYAKGDYSQARYCFSEAMRCSEPGSAAYNVAKEYLAKM